jgi:hypothetical protein
MAPATQRLPDGGYGWVIVCGSFINMVISGITCFSFGKIMAEFVDEFGCSVMVGSLVGSLLFGATLLFCE